MIRGLIRLGCPLGSDAFVQQHMMAVVDKITKTTHIIINKTMEDGTATRRQGLRR